MGVEPIITAWKAVVLPLHYCCMDLLRSIELPTSCLRDRCSAIELQENDFVEPVSIRLFRERLWSGNKVIGAPEKIRTSNPSLTRRALYR